MTKLRPVEESNTQCAKHGTLIGNSLSNWYLPHSSVKPNKTAKPLSTTQLNCLQALHTIKAKLLLTVCLLRCVIRIVYLCTIKQYHGSRFQCKIDLVPRIPNSTGQLSCLTLAPPFTVVSSCDLADRYTLYSYSYTLSASQ